MLRLRLVAIEDGSCLAQTVHRYEGEPAPVLQPAVSPSGEHLALAGEYGELVTWRIEA